MVDRIRYTGVLGDTLVAEIYLAVLVYGNVLQKSVPLDCIVDVGLGLFAQVDDLCVAAAFEVEDAVIVPAMLVVTYERTFGIC